MRCIDTVAQLEREINCSSPEELKHSFHFFHMSGASGRGISPDEWWTPWLASLFQVYVGRENLSTHSFPCRYQQKADFAGPLEPATLTRRREKATPVTRTRRLMKQPTAQHNMETPVSWPISVTIQRQSIVVVFIFIIPCMQGRNHTVHTSKHGGSESNKARIEGEARVRAGEGSGEGARWAPSKIFCWNFELQIVQSGV